MKNVKIEFTNERIILASGIAVVGAILGKGEIPKMISEKKGEWGSQSLC